MNIFPVKVTGILYIIYGLITFFVYLETSDIPLTELFEDLELFFLSFLPIPILLVSLGIGIFKGEKHVAIISLFLLPAAWIWITTIIAFSGIGGRAFPIALWSAHLLLPFTSFILTIWTLVFLKRKGSKTSSP